MKRTGGNHKILQWAW